MIKVIVLFLITVTCFALYSFVVPNGWFIFAGIIAMFMIGDVDLGTRLNRKKKKKEEQETVPSLFEKD